jgi:hypothetical protein
MEDLVGNEENEYPVPDPNKTMINELSDAHKKSLKEEIMDKIPAKLMEKLQVMVTTKYKMHLSFIKRPLMKNLRWYRNN